MERTISATDANREFSRLMGEIAGGESYVVTSRGKPVMRMTPVQPVGETAAERRQRMRALLETLASLPVRNAGRVNRDDGYE
ncbi:MAG TPA: type II toxin-antitoxin system prevent-host-death family antitoxin [Brevundimonas sp.]|uniref:type II toxin-antitoxin system Phd/YefM family antitoxin n=1 Tax=Brevundimonas sp. TaxID=1871086 RepID=UPI00262CEA0B|nr:type II toxin-antitoxin system prevent-host-death family antitoxin [Brevundimonas sp.]HRO32563.1 type II toxin-antitoxin system prevent-host-death family antitoxin [Brevundimonas sp.]